jgi:hypothetical protein
MPKDFGYQNVLASNLQFDHDVLLLEDCGGANVWSAAGDGSDFTNAFAAPQAYFGTLGWKIATKTTSPAATDDVTVSRPLTYPRTPRLVFRTRMRIPAKANVEYVCFELVIYDGVNYYSAALTITPITPKVEYGNPGIGVVEITDFAFVWTNLDWVMVEFAVDLVTHEYLGFWLNGKSYPAQGIAIANLGAQTRRGVLAQIILHAQTTAIAEVDIDSLYIGSATDL